MVKNDKFGPISIDEDEQEINGYGQRTPSQLVQRIEMIIKEREMQGVPVLILSGKLDLFAKNSLKEVIQKHKENKTQRVLIDMKSVSFIDSAGLGILAVAVKMFKDIKGNLILVNPQEMVKGALQNANFASLIPMFNTNDDYTEFSPLS
ncbi:MAG: STAS domain-containing protein [Nitrospirota bacterium]|nr:STAS domain-containing protein [Nitrospirota bacterium]